MGLSIRKFTKEFKLAAVRRLEQGVSTAEVAWALEVNPNVLTAGGGSSGISPVTRFPAMASSAGRIFESTDIA